MNVGFLPSFPLRFLLQVVLLDHNDFLFALLSNFLLYNGNIGVFLLLLFSKIRIEVGGKQR